MHDINLRMDDINLRMALAVAARMDILQAARNCLEQGTGLQESVLQGAASPAVLLLDILRPLQALGAIRHDARDCIDTQLLRRFFIGVLHWTPRTLFDDASLPDLQAAFEGYQAQQGLRHPPRARTLAELMQKFPDLTGEPP